MGFIKNLYNKL